MMTPPTPACVGDEQSSPSTKIEKRKRRKEKARFKSDKKHKRRAEKKQQQHERGGADSPAREMSDQDSITEHFGDAQENKSRARLESHSTEEPKQATNISHTQQHLLKTVQAKPRHISPMPLTPRHEEDSNSHARQTARTRFSEQKHEHTEKRHRPCRETPTRTITFNPHSRLASLTPSSEHEHEHERDKKRRKTCHQDSKRSYTQEGHNPSVLQNAILKTHESDSERHLEQKLDDLIQDSLSLPFPPLNPLEHLLSLPTYSPIPSNPILSSAYTLIGSMQAEQFNSYDQSAELDTCIKHIRATPWKMNHTQQEEIERLREMKDVCENFAMELMLEEGAFRDSFGRGWEGERWELGKEVDGMKERVAGLMREFEERMEGLGGEG